MTHNILAALFLVNCQAVILLLVILSFRLVLRRISKRYVCLLWSLLILRLLCPFSIESPAALLPDGDAALLAVFPAETPAVHADAGGSARGLPALTQKEARSFPAEEGLFFLWLSGAAFFSLRFLFQYLYTRRTVRFAVRLKANVWECEGIASPFVFGIFRPKIYLPFHVEEQQRKQIVRHEAMHIKYHDPLLFLLAALAACLHWANPLVWYGIRKMRQDIEMRCDEAVLQSASIQEKKLYSATLLQFASVQSQTAFVLPFGESLTENRIVNIFHVKSITPPATAVIRLFICLCSVPLFTVSSLSLPPAPEPADASLSFAGSAVLDAPAFAKQVLAYVEEGNAKGLSDLVTYPFVTQRDGVRLVIASPEEFIQHYPKIVTDATRQDVLSTSPDALFSNWMGYMLGSGGIWFSDFDQRGFYIIAINDFS